MFTRVEESLKDPPPLTFPLQTLIIFKNGASHCLHPLSDESADYVLNSAVSLTSNLSSVW